MSNKNLIPIVFVLIGVVLLLNNETVGKCLNVKALLNPDTTLQRNQGDILYTTQIVRPSSGDKCTIVSDGSVSKLFYLDDIQQPELGSHGELFRCYSGTCRYVFSVWSEPDCTYFLNSGVQLISPLGKHITPSTIVTTVANTTVPTTEPPIEKAEEKGLITIVNNTITKTLESVC